MVSLVRLYLPLSTNQEFHVKSSETGQGSLKEVNSKVRFSDDYRRCRHLRGFGVVPRVYYTGVPLSFFLPQSLHFPRELDPSVNVRGKTTGCRVSLFFFTFPLALFSVSVVLSKTFSELFPFLSFFYGYPSPLLLCFPLHLDFYPLPSQREGSLHYYFDGFLWSLTASPFQFTSASTSVSKPLSRFALYRSCVFSARSSVNSPDLASLSLLPSLVSQVAPFPRGSFVRALPGRNRPHPPPPPSCTSALARLGGPRLGFSRLSSVLRAPAGVGESGRSGERPPGSRRLPRVTIQGPASSNGDRTL